MSDLPEWIGLTEVDNYYDNMQLRKALAIAWEALERTSECIFTTIHGHKIAKDAMRRIEELGK